MINQVSLAVVKIEWSKNSHFLIVLHFTQEVCIWNLENQISKMVHKISFSHQTPIKSIINDPHQILNYSFLAHSSHQFFRISFSTEKYEIFNYLNEEIKETELENEEFFDFGYFSCGAFSPKGDLFFIPYYESSYPVKKNKKKMKIKGFFSFEIDLKERNVLNEVECLQEINSKSSNKILSLSSSNYFYLNYQKKEIFQKQDENALQSYSLIATLCENNILIWKISENKAKSSPPTLLITITDFKYLLNFCLWIDEYTLFLLDENGRIWFVKFTCMELGVPLKFE